MRAVSQGLKARKVTVGLRDLPDPRGQKEKPGIKGLMDEKDQKVGCPYRKVKV